MDDDTNAAAAHALNRVARCANHFRGETIELEGGRSASADTGVVICDEDGARLVLSLR